MTKVFFNKMARTVYKIFGASLLCVGVFLVFSVWKAQASIYTVCSSGCDQTTIQGIFDNNDLEAGDIVEIRADAPGGNKTFNETVVWGSEDGGAAGNPVILRGRSGDNIIIDAQNIRNRCIFLSDTDYGKIENLSVQNAIERNIQGASTTDGVVLDGITSTGGDSSLWFNAGMGIEIRNSRINQPDRYGLVFYDGEVIDAVVDNNDFVGVPGKTFRRGMHAINITNITFTNNTITDWTTADSYDWNFCFLEADGAVVSNNVFSGCDGYNLVFKGGSGISGVGNTITDPEGIGAYFLDAAADFDDFEVSGQTLTAGIRADGTSNVNINDSIVHSSNRAGFQPNDDVKLPILMVHGLGGSSAAWDLMKQYLVDAGYDLDLLYTVNITTDNNLLCSVNHLPFIKTKIEQIALQTGFERVDVIGHSRGGLNVYNFMRYDDGADRVRNWISLSGANQACPDLYPDTPEDTTPGDDTKYTSIYSIDDELAGPEQRIIPGAHNIELSGLSHSEVRTSSSVVPYVFEALNGGGYNDNSSSTLPESHGFLQTDAATLSCNGCEAYGNEGDGFGANGNGALTCDGCSSHDNGITTYQASGDGFSAQSSSTLNLYNSIAYGNRKAGVAASGRSNGEIINCSFFDNVEASFGSGWDGAGDTGIGIHSSGNWTIKNNISQGHPVEIMVTAGAVSGGIGFLSDHNDFYDSLGGSAFNYGGVFSGLTAFKAASGQDANSFNSDPLFLDAVTGNFALGSSSLAIDAGIHVDGITIDCAGICVDRAGNPIYGRPDLGAYEYQPTLVMGTDPILTDADITVYGDGLFRERETANGGIAEFSIDIPGSTTTDYLDIAITEWSDTGMHRKSWTEASDALGLTSTLHIVGDLEAGKHYVVKVDDEIGRDITGADCVEGNCLADGTGRISFTYGGSYSSHTFEVEEEDLLSPSIPILSAPADNANGSGVNIVFEWLPSVDEESGLSSYRLYVDGVSVAGNIASTSLSYALNGQLDCGSHTWFIRATDNNDNFSDSVSRVYSRSCSGGGSTPLWLLTSTSTPTSVEEKGFIASSTIIGTYENLPIIEASQIPSGEPQIVYAHNMFVPLSQNEKNLYEKMSIPAGMEMNARYSLAYFIHYGTVSTHGLGSGERAGVLLSFQSALGRLPASIADWSDVIAIANGRLPVQRSESAEEYASGVFFKLYSRKPDRLNPADEASVMMISYGLRPVRRELADEKKAIDAFGKIYKRVPANVSDWSIVRVLAYSGSKP